MVAPGSEGWKGVNPPYGFGNPSPPSGISTINQRKEKKIIKSR